jgi:sec-independent protein translocase protein TatA
MGSLSIWHWIVVIAVILLLFGRGKISELMGDVAQGIKAFKKGMSEEETAKTDAPGSDPKTIDHQTPPPQQSGTASSSAGSTAAGMQQRS